MMIYKPTLKFHRFGTFTTNLSEIFGKKGGKYAIKRVIYKSLGPPYPNHAHLGQIAQIKPIFFCVCVLCPLSHPRMLVYLTLESTRSRFSKILTWREKQRVVINRRVNQRHARH